MTTKDLQDIARIANETGNISYFYEKTGLFRYSFQDNKSEIHHINEIIFDPEFGKAYFGVEEVCEKCGTPLIYSNPNATIMGTKFQCKCNAFCIIAWRYHFRTYVGMSYEERMEYMMNDLRRRNKI